MFFEPVQELSQFYSASSSPRRPRSRSSSGVLEEPSSVPACRPSRRGSLRPAGEVTLRPRRRSSTAPGRPVLHDVNLDIAAGSTIALVGRTGAGKSTIARLLSRFYDPTQGRVLLDGVDLHQTRGRRPAARRSWPSPRSRSCSKARSRGTSGLAGPTPSRAEIEAAAKAIGAHEFITALPEGYDTDVAKRGGRLSSGSASAGLASPVRSWPTRRC